jgi:hypothetical protein
VKTVNNSLICLDNLLKIAYDFSDKMKEPDDAALIERIARAQKDAFDELYDRYTLHGHKLRFL